MKKTLLLSTIMCMVATTSLGAEVRPYIEGKISENFTRSKISEGEDFNDVVLGGALSLGLAINDMFRIEVEGFYNKNAKDTYFILPVELEAKGLFLNFYTDFRLPDIERVKPYLGLGMGCSWLKQMVKAGFYTSSANDVSFAANWGAGINYKLSQNVNLNLGYRYEYLGSIEYGSFENKITNHKVLLGVRYTF